MSELKTEFQYDLEQSFEYALNGEQKEATFLRVKMPTGRLSEYTSIIDQEFLKASAYIEHNYSSLTTPPPTKTTDGEEIKEVEKVEESEKADDYRSLVKILGAGNSDMNKCYQALRNLLTASIGNFAFCKIDDSVKFGSANFDMLSMRDINNILGRYIESFL
ncbi:hypothetical protein KAR91_10550 [Candidatus Pacearchaeota archaeon]|nr:hypothetical protein [Candidatus Pacearchaeota archaeon]